MAVNENVERIEGASAKANFLSKLAAHHGVNARNVGEVVLRDLSGASFQEQDIAGVKLFKLSGFSKAGNHRVTVTTFKPTKASLVNPNIPITVSFDANGPSAFIVKNGRNDFAYGSTPNYDTSSHLGFSRLINTLQSEGFRNVNELNALADARGKHYSTVTTGSKRGLVNELKNIATKVKHDDLHSLIDALSKGMTVTELHDSRDYAKLIGSFGDNSHELCSVILHKAGGNSRFKPLLTISQHVGDFDTHTSMVSRGVHVLRDLDTDAFVFTHFEDENYLDSNPGLARAVGLLRAHGVREV